MAQLTIQQALETAMRFHRAGRLQEAEQLYRQILAIKPDHPIYRDLVSALIARGQLDEAIAVVRRAIALRPSDAQANSRLGDLLQATGQLDESVAGYRRAIALDPDLAEAYMGLGNVLDDKGQRAEAIAAYRSAVTIRPGYAEAHNNLGLGLQASGQLDEAIAAYRQAMTLKPGEAEAPNNLGNALKAKGQIDEAITAYRLAIARQPNYAKAHLNLGIVLRTKGQPGEAIAACRKAIVLDPNCADAHCSLGNALLDQGKFKDAIAPFHKAIALDPNLPEAHNNLGNALSGDGQLDDAIAAYRQAISLRPGYGEAYNNLGVALKDGGRLDDAVAALRHAIVCAPDNAEAHTNLGVALQERGQLDDAITAYRRAIAIDPDLSSGHSNLAHALLLMGDYQRGWEENEWRLKGKGLASASRCFAQPRWDGSALDDRTLLLHVEQGFGDTIQFVRYLPLVARRARKIILECYPQLQRVFETAAHLDSWQCQIVPRGKPLPAFDLHCPLLSLPLVFNTTLESIPAREPYLFPDPTLVDFWRDKLNPSGSELKIGIAWAGSPTFKGDRTRSMSLDRLAPLAKVRRAIFFSVQKGEAERQAEHPPAGMRLVNLAPDFANTAAVMSLMDLVITTDTSIAHLAGALGRPTWVMLQFVPDWRWLLDREDSPWYPSMRLFRQQVRGDWDGVIKRVLDALAILNEDRKMIR